MNAYIAIIVSLILILSALHADFRQETVEDISLGAFTQLTQGTRLTDFVDIYNTHLEQSIEVGTTSIASITTLPSLTSAASLATIGTIISGIWNGTVIGVAYNGTGTTSPTDGYVMLGAGATGFRNVVGQGVSGQFLTSQGAGSDPTWTTGSIDQTAVYNFTGTYFGILNLNASSTAANPITLNNLAYNTPSVRAASSTVLIEDGSGNLTWQFPEWRILSATTTENNMIFATSTFATATELRITITAAITNGNDNLAGYFLDSNFERARKGNAKLLNIFDIAAAEPVSPVMPTSYFYLGTASTSVQYVTMDISNPLAAGKQFTYKTTTGVDGTNLPGYAFGWGSYNDIVSPVTQFVLFPSAGNESNGAGQIAAGATILIEGRNR